MSLDAQGVLAAVTLAIYLPVFFFAVRIALKYKRHGWILLVLFTLSKCYFHLHLVHFLTITQFESSEGHS